MKIRKKEKYIPIVGLMGVGEDYNVYVLSLTEKILGFGIGFVAGFIAVNIMFGVPLASMVLGIGIGIIAIPIFRDYLFEKRKKNILSQFRDMLDTLSNSFSAGKNTPDAFADCLSDMRMAYGDEAPLVKELNIIINGLHNNFVIEDLLRDMAKRCGIDDMVSFAETFAVCNRLGGNLKRVVSESRDIINDKIEIEMEIQTTITASKNELHIMCVMPFVIVSMMGMIGDASITENSLINVIVKIIAIAMFAFAYKMGKNITDIKV